MKRFLLGLWQIGAHIRAWIWLSRTAARVPVLGKPVSMILDRLLLMVYGLDVTSASIFVVDLRIPHPGGVLLGGNGIRSHGRVLINAGVKFVGHSPENPEYLARHAERRVFDLGDNVVFGANCVVIGPVTICDNVMIGAMSLVNKDIIEPGIYVGSPVRKISDQVNESWVS
ncbi:MAG: hypothetical protein AB8B85_01140 [Paracoccaceae bacterium]